MINPVQFENIEVLAPIVKVFRDKLPLGVSIKDMSAEKHFRELCDHPKLADIACVLFHKSTVLAVNKPWSLLWQYSEDEVRGQTLKLLQGPKSETRELRSFEESLRDRSSFSQAKLVNYTKNGRELQCTVFAFAVGEEHYVSFMSCGNMSMPNGLHDNHKTDIDLNINNVRLQ